MTLQSLMSASAVHEFLRHHEICLVTFSAHWCGPCQRSKPQLEALAAKSPVPFGIAYESDLGSDLSSFQVRAFPTYVLYRSEKEVQRVEGANMPAIEQMVNAAQQQVAPTFTGAGNVLSSSANGTGMSAEEARAARLARFGAASDAGENASATPDVEMKDAAPDPGPVPKENGDETALPMEDVVAAPDVAVDAPAGNELDQAVVNQLVNDMGFTELRAKKGLIFGEGNTLESAVEWLMIHQDDDDIDEPIVYPTPSTAVAQSYKCNECGKILSNMANLELHANKTGHADFEESTESVVPLTDEQKAAKVLEIKALLKAKRAERETAEKNESIEREKQRRNMAKEMTKTREQLEAEQRKRDMMALKREKEAVKRERERIRAELAKDKAERMANKGKLHSKLGVQGYNPDAIQYDAPPAAEAATSTPAVAPPEAAADSPSPAPAVVDMKKIDDYITKVSSYKAGGDGGACLKILRAYISNVVAHPEDAKYRSINMENKVYKQKVKPFVGGKQLLLATGFHQVEEALVLEHVDLPVLSSIQAKLEAAMKAYGV
jgi:UBX domain-containing protein 1/4